ncbi:Fatty acid hydroxylase domain-containing protein 2 [Trichoderma ghanense]|uniref:Fatty acid hydroxylase domain-containing protein 2 n=1 Tax=Trichoderma ghanense TaxID=65468 RepID=A0ABY2HJA1_9HYPO
MTLLTSAEALWATIVRTHNPITIDLLGTLLIQLLFWWTPCTIFLTLDTLLPSFSARHKLQPPPKQPSSSEILHSIHICLRNQLLVLILHATLLLLLLSSSHHPPAIRIDPRFPSAKESTTHILASILLREILFYASHRALHWGPLYRRFHKTHHRFTAPVAFASQYAHPVEHIVANVLPILLPPAILRAHILTMWAFLALQLVETSTVHSGYDFFGGAARKHDRHHERFDVYFGGIGLLDWALGTDERERLERRKKE